MEENKVLKIISLCGFLAFAAVSCWATAESLHLLLSSWPVVLCWIVSIGFFVIASLGTKMIVDSLNQNIYLEKRGLRFIGGIILFLVFWLICIMPTNTHTFFYRSTITDIVTQDLATTKGYLQQLRDNIKTEAAIKLKADKLESDVNAQIIALENEIDNIVHPGFGERSKAILDGIASTLQVAKIPELSYSNTSQKTIKGLKQQYRTMIYELLNKRKEELKENYISPQEKLFKPESAQQIKNIETMEGHVANMGAIGHVDNDVIMQSDMVLKKSYATIKNYADFINFNVEEDKARYLADNQITRTSGMLSVIDVWKNFVTGEYKGRGFVFWVVIAILVDIAAFVFFDITFKKKEDYEYKNEY